MDLDATRNHDSTDFEMTATERELMVILYVARNAVNGIAEDSAQNAHRVRFHLEALINGMTKGKLPRVRA